MSADKLRMLIYNSTGAEYEEVTSSRPHQLQGIAFSLYMRRALLFYWMRLGKSKMALDWCAHLRKARLARKKGLILAHAPIGVDVWEGELAKHSRLNATMVRSGPNAHHNFVDALEDENCQLIVMSRFTLQALMHIKKPNRKGVMTEYPDHAGLRMAASFFDHAVIDETHFYMDHYGLPFMLAKAIVAQCTYRLGLTGTPVGRDPMVAWSQTAMVDDGEHMGTRFEFFQQAFGRYKYDHFAGHKYVFNPKKMDIFQYKLDSFTLAYGKGEVKSATVDANVVHLTMFAEQRKFYNDTVTKVLKLHATDQEGIRSSFHTMRQIASGYLQFVQDDGKEMFIHFDSVKMRWLMELVAELPADCPCLIFHEYRHTGELIGQALTKAKVKWAAIRGDTKNNAESVRRFQAGAVQYLVANTATGGTSIDLPQAEYMCFFESPVSPMVRAQAEARPMARGDRGLVVDDLVCAPIEDKVLGFIREGKNLLARILAGGGKTAKDLFA